MREARCASTGAAPSWVREQERLAMGVVRELFDVVERGSAAFDGDFAIGIALNAEDIAFIII